MPDTIHTTVESPIGSLLLAGDGTRLTRLGFPSGKGAVQPKPDWRRDDAAFAEARRQLTAYFDRRLTRFDIPLDPRGTPFQLDVWRALLDIPAGETISYGELARRIGRPSASRAVGAANGANPLPIVIPCHRVIGASGKLTGFAGGIPTKTWLLDHERGHDAPATGQLCLL